MNVKHSLLLVALTKVNAGKCYSTWLVITDICISEKFKYLYTNNKRHDPVIEPTEQNSSKQAILLRKKEYARY